MFGNKTCCYSIAIAGIALTVLSTVGLIYFPAIISNKIKESLPLTEGSASLERFSVVKVPITMSFTFFEVTNWLEVTEGTAKPRLIERGPYVFNEKKRKEIVNVSENHLTYRQYKTFQFNANLSVGSLEDEITIVNVPAIVMSGLIHKKVAKSPLKGTVLKAVENLMKSDNQKLYTKRSVREILFEGYQIGFIAELKKKLASFGITQLNLPDTFGLFLGKNGTHDGEFFVDNGASDVSQFTQIQKWQGKEKVNFWGKDTHCNHINGTDGAQFHPDLQRTDKLWVFSPELCRSIFLEYIKDSEVKGITTYQFSFPERLLTAPSKSIENECFCVKKNDPICNFDGLMDASPCKKGAPIALSSPHFYNGDRRLQKGVIGLNPRKELHSTYLNIEPNTGFVFDAAQRLQINLVIRNMPDVMLLRNVDDLILPVLWLQESASIDDDSASKFKSKVTHTLVIANSVFVTLIFIGIVLIFVSLARILLEHLPASQGYSSPVATKIGST
ncbi:lysosome membrane protein 2-like [Brevipalpus obovatus]|uniref:lysosome membrane protein 2-like n=1 Tax=Brevipalpus obovatus TaxID=246614 RepID=UPI003D9F6B27